MSCKYDATFKKINLKFGSEVIKRQQCRRLVLEGNLIITLFQIDLLKTEIHCIKRIFWKCL